MLSEFKLTPVTPSPTVKTVDALPPLTVTRFVSVAPNPVAAPVMETLLETDNRPWVSVMVFSAAVLLALKTVELKLIFAGVAGGELA
jgi:hypothetical protein